MDLNLKSRFQMKSQLMALAALWLASSITYAHHGGAPQEAEPKVKPVVVELKRSPGMEQMYDELAKVQVVLVGEQHDRVDHHNNQLSVLKGLHARKPNLILGVEWFQRRFQPVLDDFIAGRIDEKEMLERTEYFQRWRYDYRLYRDILVYARDNKIPLIALNAEAELTRQISRKGIGGLDAEVRAQLPEDIQRAEGLYRERLLAVFNSHPNSGNLENFLDVQITWDETMADSAAKAMQARNYAPILVLAGSGHIIYGDGIPKRIARRTGLAYRTVLTATEGVPDSEMADYLLLTEAERLPPSGRIGAFLDDKTGKVLVMDLVKDGAAMTAGLEKGDVITAINGKNIKLFSDLKWELMQTQPGDTITLGYRRDGMFGDKEREVELVLKR